MIGKRLGGDRAKTDSGRTVRERSIVNRPKRSERITQTRQRKESVRREAPKTGRAESPRHVRNRAVNETRVVNRNRNTTLVERTRRGTERRRPRGTRRVIYEDRRRIGPKSRRHEHVYRDRHRRLCHRIIWPRYHFPVYYRWGPRVVFRHVYPYYHRRYVFVSLGGFWPTGYTYVRYYWYPSHYYHWYGYDPVPREVHSDTYNYYTYNYYGDGTSTSYGETTDLAPVDHTTFTDVREKLAQQAEGPAAEALSDTLFEEGVKAFEQADYAGAAEKFAAAMELAPDDVILPFAYAQALFADSRYAQAAEALRSALDKVSPEQGVFYPRGLYIDEETLMTQIYRLQEEAEQYLFNTDLQLLLGYHRLGVGEVDSAMAPLTKAKGDYRNSAAASVLLELAEKLREENANEPNE